MTKNLKAVLIYTGTECPTGYSRLSELDNRFIRGGTGYGATGGASTVTQTLDLTIQNGGGQHSHSFSGSTNMAPTDNNMEKSSGGPDYYIEDHSHFFQGSTGDAGTEHTHSINDPSFTIDTTPPYTTALFCKKD